MGAENALLKKKKKDSVTTTLWAFKLIPYMNNFSLRGLENSVSAECLSAVFTVR